MRLDKFCIHTSIFFIFIILKWKFAIDFKVKWIFTWLYSVNLLRKSFMWKLMIDCPRA